MSFARPIKSIKFLISASGETVLAPGTSRNIIFEGGPKALPGQAQLKRYLSLVNAYEFAQAWDLDQNSINVVLARVHCKGVGNTELQLSLVPTNDDRNIQARGSVRVICAFPYKLVLAPNLPEPDLQLCTTAPGSYVTLANRELEVVAHVYDRHSRKFDNVSSLVMDWTLDPPELAPKLPREMMEDLVREETYGLMMPGRIYHVVKPWGNAGSLNIKASLQAEGVSACFFFSL
jgi:nuclear pore complex protein Nup210